LPGSAKKNDLVVGENNSNGRRFEKKIEAIEINIMPRPFQTQGQLLVSTEKQIWGRLNKN